MSYIFNTTPNSYFRGQDVRVEDTRTHEAIFVSIKDGMWAVEVKYKGSYLELSPVAQLAIANLSEDTVEAIEQGAKDAWWEMAHEIASEHNFERVFSSGRSGGWACLDGTENWEPSDLLDPDDVYSQQFLACAFALVESMKDAVADFETHLRDAQLGLQLELSEYADWVGVEVQTPDGALVKVAELKVVNGRAALRDGVAFCFANEATLVRKADGNVPARLTADPIMEQVFQIIEARGFFNREQIEGFLDEVFGPGELYELHIGPKIDSLEDALKTYTDDQ